MINVVLLKCHTIVKDHLIIITNNNNNCNQRITDLHQNHVMEQILIFIHRFFQIMSTSPTHIKIYHNSQLFRVLKAQKMLNNSTFRIIMFLSNNNQLIWSIK